jgi:hypothetical protein
LLRNLDLRKGLVQGSTRPLSGPLGSHGARRTTNLVGRGEFRQICHFYRIAKASLRVLDLSYTSVSPIRHCKPG